MEIPFLNLAKQNKKLADDILPIWKEILESAQFIGGEHVTSFESEFAVACGTNYCATVASGTDALRLILISLGLKPGDEVITVPNTFIGTTESYYPGRRFRPFRGHRSTHLQSFSGQT